MFLFLIVLSRTFAASTPIIPTDMIYPQEESQLTAPMNAQDYKLRTRLDIIWSYASTLFICTWVAIHPNVPPRREVTFDLYGDE